MAYTESDLTAVRAARLRGEKTVVFADRQVTYKSDDELRQLEQDILHELGTSSPRRKQAYAVASKGF